MEGGVYHTRIDEKHEHEGGGVRSRLFGDAAWDHGDLSADRNHKIVSLEEGDEELRELLQSRVVARSLKQRSDLGTTELDGVSEDESREERTRCATAAH
mgnify:FL=1